MSPPTPPDAAAKAPRGESRPHHLPLWQKMACAASGLLVGIAVTYLGWWTGRW